MNNNIAFVFENNSDSILNDFKVLNMEILGNGEGNAKHVKINYSGKYVGYYMEVDLVNNHEEGCGVIKTAAGIKFVELNFTNGKANGKYKFYNDGVLIEEGFLVNNLRDGVCIFSRPGLPTLFNEYRQGTLVATLQEFNREWKLYKHYPVRSNQPDMIAQYNRDFKLNGYVITLREGRYDSLTEYNNGSFIRKLKGFFYGTAVINGQTVLQKQCRELDENGCKVYEGEYLDDIGELFPAHGIGTTYNGASSTIVMQGEFFQGTFLRGKIFNVEGMLVYDGYCWNGFPHGEGTLYIDAKPYVKGMWRFGYYSFPGRNIAINWENPRQGMTNENVLQSDLYQQRVQLLEENPMPPQLQLQLQSQLQPQPPSPSPSMPRPSSTSTTNSSSSMPPNSIIPPPSPGGPNKQQIVQPFPAIVGVREIVTIIRIPDNMCNQVELGSVDFSGIINLSTILVGNNAFKNTKKVSFKGMKNLRSITIGVDSFSPVFSGVIPNDPAHPELNIVNCPQLQQIKLGPGSFACYTTANIKYLPRLQILQIGKVDVNKACFCYAENCSLLNLPNLKELEMGGLAFARCRKVVFSGMPYLTKILIGEMAMQGDPNNIDTNKFTLYCMFTEGC